MKARVHPGAKRAAAGGFSLVELMVAMLIGLVVIAGVVSAMLASRQSYRTSDAMSGIQQGLRTAFELMARDIRQAGATICGSTDVANVINSTGTAADDWWKDWVGITGYAGDEDAQAVSFGTGNADRVAGTGAIRIIRVEDVGITVTEHNATSANFKISKKTSEIEAGDIVMVCDLDHAAIFQVTNYNDSNVTLVHNTGGPETPGNCSKGLGYPTDCSGPNGNDYSYGANSSIGKMVAVLWYVGYNGRAEDGNTALYRAMLSSSGTVVQEIVPGISDLQAQYRVQGSADFTDTPSSWENVNAVELTLDIQSTTSNVSTDTATSEGRLVMKGITYVITIMTRVQ